MVIEQNSILTSTTQIGALYFLYATVGACFTTSLSEALKLEAAAVSATVLTGIFKACDRSDHGRLKKLGELEPFVFSMMDVYIRDCLVHEMGHAIAARLFYSNARPKITIFPFLGGKTAYIPSGLTALERSLGKKRRGSDYCSWASCLVSIKPFDAYDFSVSKREKP